MSINFEMEQETLQCKLNAACVDQERAEEFCGDCDDNDNGVWYCLICDNVYDKNVKECPNEKCNEVIRKDKLLNIINKYIDDGSQWRLSEYTNDLILEIRKNNVYSS